MNEGWEPVGLSWGVPPDSQFDLLYSLDLGMLHKLEQIDKIVIQTFRFLTILILKKQTYPNKIKNTHDQKPD